MGLLSRAPAAVTIAQCQALHSACGYGEPSFLEACSQRANNSTRCIVLEVLPTFSIQFSTKHCPKAGACILLHTGTQHSFKISFQLYLLVLLFNCKHASLCSVPADAFPYSAPALKPGESGIGAPGKLQSDWLPNRSPFSAACYFQCCHYVDH